MLKNPFFIYIISFSSALFFYNFGWSEIYPNLTANLLLFFISTFILAAFLAIFISGSIKKIKAYKVRRLPRIIFPLLILSFVLDIAYAGGIPIVMVSSATGYDYSDFGIPTFHVVIMTFSQAYAIIKFSDYIYSKKIVYLFEVSSVILYYLLIINRGAILFTLTSIIFLIVIKIKKIKIIYIVSSFLFILAALYAFGLIGETRSGDVIDEIGAPTYEFKESGVPQPFFWAYIYSTSPIANLQNTINLQEKNNYNFSGFITYELLPDFISKHLASLINQKRTDFYRITTALNVGSIFTRPYVYLGWLGPITIFLYLSLIIILYTRIIKNSIYSVPSLALLNTLIVFCIFDNMITFSGMMLQLCWLPFLNKIFSLNYKCIANKNYD